MDETVGPRMGGLEFLFSLFPATSIKIIGIVILFVPPSNQSTEESIPMHNALLQILN
jgi:hypothetical protein